ncbi:MAG TPA: hypothetical protein VJ895_00500 [Candidatus Nanoarchaeia archaeon]|nr:hypothetical protein [Candidatus Nanoarchaeia archaeon]
MKRYQYKIQWLFNNIEELETAIKLLGVKSLDKIILRDFDLNIIDEYNGFIQFPYGLSEVKTIEYIKAQIKKEDIRYFEVLRK